MQCGVPGFLLPLSSFFCESKNPHPSFDSFSLLHILRSVSPPVSISCLNPQSKKTHNLSPVTEARLEKLLSEQTVVVANFCDGTPLSDYCTVVDLVYSG